MESNKKSHFHISYWILLKEIKYINFSLFTAI